MALQKNIDLDTGIPANNCYIRIHSVEAEKQNEASDWSLRVLVNVYKDAETRNKQITVTGVSRPDYHYLHLLMLKYMYLIMIPNLNRATSLH